LPDVKPPPSLNNIFKELYEDLAIPIAKHGYLQSWAEQGVLLLNSVLTVEDGQPASHQRRGWELFTDAIVEILNAQQDGLVFLLWGSYAHKKGAGIDRQRHLVIETPHPSPLSAYRGFFGSKPFSKTNAYLSSRGEAVINWQLPT
jgi:uracil-DNA glycosylase